MPEPCGVVLMDKPEGFTSFDLCAKLRRVFSTKRIGHAGTLDPMATGLMVVLLGRATLLADILPDQSKGYRAGFRLGITTDTLDITGEIVSELGYVPLSPAQLEDTLARFRGEIEQLPPMYSAVHKDGKRLYELARQGIEVERERRCVSIDRLELVSFDEHTGEGVLEVKCSKGTYIRSLIDDIGQALGMGAVMTSLRRTQACGFDVSAAHTLDSVNTESVIPPDSVLGGFARVNISQAQSVRYRNGGALDLARVRCEKEPGELVRVYCGEFIGVGRIADGEVRPYKLISDPRSV